jgi:hypothetical protein
MGGTNGGRGDDSDDGAGDSNDRDGDSNERDGDVSGDEFAPESIPFDGDVLRYAGATASVAPKRIGPLLRTAQAHLGPRLDSYRRSFERVFADDERELFLVPVGHWADVGAELGLSEHEGDALQRTHDQQLRRIGTKTGRREELETALEIREAVVIGFDSGE